MTMSVVNLNYQESHQPRSNKPHDYYAKKLSKDKPYIYNNGGYIIFANGTRWLLNTWVMWRLYWIPVSLCGKNDNEINYEKGMLEYQCTWLNNDHKYSDIKWIIYHHPNLRKPKTNWLLKFLAP